MKSGRVGGREIADLWPPIQASQCGITNRSDLSGSPKCRARLPEFFLVQVRLLLLQGEVSPHGLAVKDETRSRRKHRVGTPSTSLTGICRPVGSNLNNTQWAESSAVGLNGNHSHVGHLEKCLSLGVHPPRPWAMAV